MYDGLWTVVFQTPIGIGSGVLVLSEGRLLGGDAGYYYTGNYSIDGDRFEGTLNVIRFDNSCISVFGDLENISLSYTGNISEYEFSAIASMSSDPGLQMSVTGNKKERL